MVCPKMIWLFSMSGIFLANISQFFIMMRIYRLWNHKQTARRVLLVVFAACTTGTFILNAITVLTFLETQIKLPPKVLVCMVAEVPKTLPSTMGILLLLDLFVILVFVYNALENPRRCESEVFDSLRRDGVRIYLLGSFFWMLLLITSLTAGITVYFPILTLVCSLKANLTSRIHLRVESLRPSNTAHPVRVYTGYDGQHLGCLCCSSQGT
ncbi:uncharacterized protein BT62DRAFT_1075115 [Guyanagaster necrorhizus]|uniref:Uncharacterized protein n=1 Tax=Guyanagaster necrorhizus TaxID=856835 RepID=A0A9P8ATU1_9AGAR|nr:uncharacterized protein BT62DRAFT_1075115 [Guyanagaster necrorhizus MCA 3950]KAG7447769.1 hypothetical protein BT62DRAFT_1075115 [Guyanagaster necrorhizus MCA 3950]